MQSYRKRFGRVEKVGPAASWASPLMVQFDAAKHVMPLRIRKKPRCAADGNSTAIFSECERIA